MDPGRPSPLKHAHRFASTAVARSRRSLPHALRISPAARLRCGQSACRSRTLPARRSSPRVRQVQESSRDVSDPTRGPGTLTPGSVRGSLTSRLPVPGTRLELGSKTAATSLVIRSVKCAPQRRVEVRLISFDIVDDFQACVSVVVELGTLVYVPRRIAHGTARRDGGRCPRYAGASNGVRPSVAEGRFMIHVARNNRPWIVIVEPDNDASVLVVVTAYEVSE